MVRKTKSCGAITLFECCEQWQSMEISFNGNVSVPVRFTVSGCALPACEYLLTEVSKSPGMRSLKRCEAGDGRPETRDGKVGEDG
eukprot:2603916-Prymnesium_polylepis.2